MKIVSLGSLNLDHVYQVDRFLLPGETKASKSLTDNASGKGLNQSIAAVRAPGRRSTTPVTSEPTPICCARCWWIPASTPSGWRIIWTFPAATPLFRWTTQDRTAFCSSAAPIVPDVGAIDRDWIQCGPDDILLLPEQRLIWCPYIIEQAARRGIPAAMNAAPMDEGRQGLSHRQTALSDRQRDRGGRGAGRTTASEETMDNLIAAYPGVGILLTLGSAGAWFHDGDRTSAWAAARWKRWWTPPPQATPSSGYFLAGMLDKLDPAEALKRATFASALTISPRCGRLHPTVDQVEAAMASGKLGTPDQDNKQ